MNFTIVNDRLQLNGKPVRFKETPNQGGRIRPEILVIHETAGSSAEGAISWLTMKRSKVSAHIVIDRAGEVTQLCDFDREAFHAGKSSWHGRASCNDFSIGIELDGPGKLLTFRPPFSSKKPTHARASFGRKYSIELNSLQFIANKTHGKGYWMPFTKAQMATLEALVQTLVDHYNLSEVVGHFEISPGRKIDPNPTLDMHDLRGVAFGDAATPADEFQTLVMGSSGPDVMMAQKRLLELGFNQVGVPDGKYGPMTRAAVLAWQAENEHATTGKLEITAFRDLLDVRSKPMIIGEETKKAEKKRADASKTIEAAAVATAASVCAEQTVKATTDISVWQTFVTTLEAAAGSMGKLKVLGVSFNSQTATMILLAIVAIAVVRWARQSRGA